MKVKDLTNVYGSAYINTYMEVYDYKHPEDGITTFLIGGIGWFDDIGNRTVTSILPGEKTLLKIMIS